MAKNKIVSSMQEMRQKMMGNKAEKMIKAGNKMNAKIGKGSAMDKMMSKVTGHVMSRVSKKK